jgi:hypothetical protein
VGTLVYVRKLLLTVLVGVVLSMAFAAPAFALRDPFDPAIDTSPASSGGGTTISTNTSGQGGGGTTTVVQSGTTSNGAQVLSNTGMDTEPWLVAAYGLIAVGGMTLFVSKSFRATA